MKSDWLQFPGLTGYLIARRAHELGVHVALGMSSKDHVDSVVCNTAVLIGSDGDLTGTSTKVHLRGEEQMAYRVGYRLPESDTGLGVIGLTVGGSWHSQRW